MTVLCSIGTLHHTDKAPWYWGYTEHYFRWLSAEREQIRVVLEVGVWRGASLRMWRDFFPNADVIGFDNDPACMVDEERISTFCLDAYDRDAAGRIIQDIGPIDLLVDDAVHFMPAQATLLRDMWPFLRDGGIYAIEECREDSLPAIMDAIAVLPDVVRLEIIYAGNYFGMPYSLALLRKGKKTRSVEPR